MEIFPELAHRLLPEQSAKTRRSLTSSTVNKPPRRPLRVCRETTAVRPHESRLHAFANAEGNSPPYFSSRNLREQLFEFFGGEAGHERLLAVDGGVDRRPFFLLQL